MLSVLRMVAGSTYVVPFSSWPTLTHAAVALLFTPASSSIQIALRIAPPYLLQVILLWHHQILSLLNQRYMHFKYLRCGSSTKSSPGAGFIGEPVERPVGQSFRQPSLLPRRLPTPSATLFELGRPLPG